METCAYFDERSLNCHKCVRGEAVNTCIQRGRTQPRLGDPLTRDVIAIHQLKNGDYDIETDIEVTCATEYPNPIEAHKIDEHNAEERSNEDVLREALEPALPKGCLIRTFHRHHTGKVGALHIHVWCRCRDFSEAQTLSKRLWQILDPDKLEDTLKEAVYLVLKDTNFGSDPT